MPISGFYFWVHLHSKPSHFWELRLWNSLQSITSVLLPSSLPPSFPLLHLLDPSLLTVLHPNTHVHMVLTLPVQLLQSHLDSLVPFSVSPPFLSPHAMLSFYPTPPLPLLEFQASGSYYKQFIISVKLGPQSWRVCSLFHYWLHLCCPYWFAAILHVGSPKPPSSLQSPTLASSLPTDASYLQRRIEGLLPTSCGYPSAFFVFFCIFKPSSHPPISEANLLRVFYCMINLTV